MKKQVIKVWDLPSSGTNISLIILSAAFFLGGLAGCVLAAQVNGSGSETLIDFLENYFSSINSGSEQKLEPILIFWDVFRWPIYIFVLSITPLGLIGIPILFFLRGFLLSFAIASFYFAIGYPGITVALVVFCLSGMISIPVCFVLGVHGFLISGQVTVRLFGDGRRQKIFRKINYIQYAVCVLSLCVCSFLEYYLIPALLSGMTSLLQNL